MGSGMVGLLPTHRHEPAFGCVRFRQSPFAHFHAASFAALSFDFTAAIGIIASVSSRMSFSWRARAEVHDLVKNCNASFDFPPFKRISPCTPHKYASSGASTSDGLIVAFAESPSFAST